jgi:uncharacterized membrane protein (DUF373 family)
MAFLRKISKKIMGFGKDEDFLAFVKEIESIVSKILSLALIFVILIAVIDLGVLLFKEVLNPSIANFNEVLVKLFGVFLNILIALELLENITAYLRKHVIQVELVIVTSLIAVARKIIILDFEKVDGVELIGLAFAIFSLAVSYWIIRNMNVKPHE